MSIQHRACRTAQILTHQPLLEILWVNTQFVKHHSTTLTTAGPALASLYLNSSSPSSVGQHPVLNTQWDNTQLVISHHPALTSLYLNSSSPS